MMPADAGIRERALDTHRSFIVQAPAGSGKTELLTGRFLALLAEVDEPEEILAITFTRKAAQEMRQRVVGALQQAGEGDAASSAHEKARRELAERVLTRSTQRDWGLVDNPGRLKIHTIDGFMTSLVGAMPWLSRLGPPPRVADRAPDLYEEAAQRVLAEVASESEGGAALRLLLRHLDNRGDWVRLLLVRFLTRRDQWLRHRARLDPSGLRPELEAALKELVKSGLEEALHYLRPYWQRVASAACYASGQVGAEHDLSALGDWDGAPSADAETLPVWRGLCDLLLTRTGDWRKPGGVNVRLGFPSGSGRAAENKKAMCELLADLQSEEVLLQVLRAVRRLPPSAYSEEQWSVLEAVIRVADLSLGALWQEMGRKGEVDFSEIAMRALSALGDVNGPSELLLALDRRLGHVLVDEFQDTSHIQIHLLQRITEGWEPGDGRSLFLVGDPMQSIYRFREADVGLFLRVMREGLPHLPLEALRLEMNFRSEKSLVDWANESFSQIFPGHSDPGKGAVPFVASQAAKAAAGVAGVELRITDRYQPRREAEQVVEQAQAALRLGSVAILGRSRTHLDEILRRLEQENLPYQGQDLDPLSERLAVRDVVSLTIAMLYPADRLAWLAVLRAPWCGMTLEDMHTLLQNSTATVPELLAEQQRMDALSEEGRRGVERLWKIIGPRLYRGRSRGVREWIENTWLQLGAPAYLTDGEYLDAMSAFDLLERLQEGTGLGPRHVFESRLAELFAAPDPRADGRLQVMTIHKAKGLEFDTVLIPALGRVPRWDATELLYWLETPEEDLLLGAVPARKHGAQDAVADYLRGLERERAEYEAQRLLYVAVTRARKKLVMWGHAAMDAQGEPKPRGRSLLAHLWPVIADWVTVDRLEDEEEKVGADMRESIIERLPCDWSAPEPLPAVRSGWQQDEPIDEPAAFEPEFDWAGETARHVGTVVHRFFQRISEEGMDTWECERVKRELPVARTQLRSLGVPPQELEAACGRVHKVLAAALNDGHGRWILQRRDTARNEWALTGLVDGCRTRVVVDRTFIDTDGTRWIIDFKTGSHEGGGEMDFLDQEVERYREQLSGYVRLFRGLEPDRPLRAALYYPLLHALREVEVLEGEGG